MASLLCLPCSISKLKQSDYRGPAQDWGCWLRGLTGSVSLSHLISKVQGLYVFVRVCVHVHVDVSLGVRSWTCVCCPAFLQSELQQQDNEPNICVSNTHIHTCASFPSLSLVFLPFSLNSSYCISLSSVSQLTNFWCWAQLGQTSGPGVRLVPIRNRSIPHQIRREE